MKSSDMQAHPGGLEAALRSMGAQPRPSMGPAATNPRPDTPGTGTSKGGGQPPIPTLTQELQQEPGALLLDHAPRAGADRLTPPPDTTRPRWRRTLGLLALALLSVGALGLAAWVLRGPSTSWPPVLLSKAMMFSMANRSLPRCSNFRDANSSRGECSSRSRTRFWPGTF